MLIKVNGLPGQFVDAVHLYSALSTQTPRVLRAITNTEAGYCWHMSS